jgi:uncharacterized membrane protein
MTLKDVYVLIMCVSAMIIILIFGRKEKSKVMKIAMLVIGDAGLFISLEYLSFDLRKNIILFILFGILNLMALIRIFKKKNPKQEQFNEWHDDPSNWKLGLFYFNREDNRILVPKRMESLGWTVNFANPLSVATFIVIIIVILVVLYVSA